MIERHIEGISFVIATTLAIGIFLYMVLVGKPAHAPGVPPANAVTAGQHCGGFIKNAPQCASGLHCQLNTSRPDTGGVCVPNTATDTPPTGR